ncbi:NAD-dependent epimerase/dehydratase family protein [Sinomonas sp. ASV322]|uniref:NAD-dependent epimerase/dehydratase family protein n=1 Tax=Sinomonas sp. ASV322 TaxID=3041920 RepID=UPI0027DB6971|nr:NAD-dependent epimerase/dehydratase family protein [Sinomonas sp. ASV322]MDQ4503888.1 NAD-dependent epimerase/dehydratase family protein [Sinomonas sp. ASV322]
MSSTYVVIGSGPVGSTVAAQLAAQGERVTVLTRSGGGPEHPLIERRAVDANDGARLAEAFDGATAVFYALNAPYFAKVWAAELPPAQRSVLDAAWSAAGASAVVVFAENLYAYSRPDEPMTEDSPRDAVGGKRGVRTQLIREREAHAANTVTMAAGDFFGPLVLNSHVGDRMVPRILARKGVQVIGSADQPHSFTYVPDMAAAMVAAARHRELWNRVLHAPTLPAFTQREMARAFATAAGLPEPRVSAIPGWVVRLVGVGAPLMRSVSEMLYQFDRPFVMDSAETQRLLGMEPTPLPVAAAATIEWWRSRGV